MRHEPQARVVGEGVVVILAVAGIAVDQGEWVKTRGERRVGTWWVMGRGLVRVQPVLV
jgi:hypothetical protein